MSCKWSFRSAVKLQNDSELQKIVQYYLFESPVPNVSVKGKTFEELGWSNHGYATLHAEMRSCSGFMNDHHWIDCPAKDVEARLRDIGRFENYDCSFEFAVHCVRDDLNKTQALFYLIRNSLAHGGFRISKRGSERYLVMENCSKGQLKGRAIIKTRALLEWSRVLNKKHCN